MRGFLLEKTGRPSYFLLKVLVITGLQVFLRKPDGQLETTTHCYSKGARPLSIVYFRTKNLIPGKSRLRTALLLDTMTMKKGQSTGN